MPEAPVPGKYRSLWFRWFHNSGWKYPHVRTGGDNRTARYGESSVGINIVTGSVDINEAAGDNHAAAGGREAPTSTKLRIPAAHTAAISTAGDVDAIVCGDNGDFPAGNVHGKAFQSFVTLRDRDEAALMARVSSA